MINYKDIRNVHLEISSFCNASCPWCPRTFWGYPFNDGYTEQNFTLDHAKKIFTHEFLKQITTIEINGNFGDIVMNTEGPDIVEYFFSCNKNLSVSISTNGSAGTRNFWERLGKTKAIVTFGIDGLEDTHHLYRQNTVWSRIIKNAGIFIAAGGTASWQFIEFDHNKHQISLCRELSKKLGFVNFVIRNDGRTTGPVFNKAGEFSHSLGNYTGEKNFQILFHKKKTDLVLVEDVKRNEQPKSKIKCRTIELKSIYISSNGDVSPCCWTGMQPKTYGHGEYYQAVNTQLSPLVKKNNALTYKLEDCITWFNEIEQRWATADYSQGRLIICDDKCGI